LLAFHLILGAGKEIPLGRRQVILLTRGVDKTEKVMALSDTLAAFFTAYLAAVGAILAAAVAACRGRRAAVAVRAAFRRCATCATCAKLKARLKRFDKKEVKGSRAQD